MIVGFAINKIESARHVPLEDLQKSRNINVNYDINMRNLAVVKSPVSHDNVLRIEFAIAINYINPSIGFIRFEGFCDYAGPDAQKSKNEWDAGHPDPGIQNEVANNMMARVIPTAMLISQNLCLPPAAPLPVINFQKQGEGGEKSRFDTYHA